MCSCSPLPSLPFNLRIQQQSSRFRISKLSKSTFNVQFPSTSLSAPTRISSTKASNKPNGSDPSQISESSSSSSSRDESLQDEEHQRSTSFDFLELKRELEKNDELVPAEGLGDGGDGGSNLRVRGGRRQMMRRSSVLAKQVISIRTARSLGFVSQLWVNTRMWAVVLIEVRPNLLSGDMEKFLLEDVSQVGDVVLVPDENVMDNELKMIGLDTLVGYSVVTPGRRNVGKVRGYSFNINSGAVESLELDSFGFSIIPSSLVSTYCLFVEDVLEVASDTVVVQADAVSRVQRLTKGIWDTQKADKSSNEVDEVFDFDRQSIRPVNSRRGRNLKGRKFRREMIVEDDGWELPMNY